MASLITSAVDGYSYLIEKTDPRTRDMFLAGSPIGMLAVVSFYLYFVRVLGPKLMENSEPFKLTTAITMYNLFQIFINGYFFFIAASIAVFHTSYLLCTSEIDDVPLATAIIVNTHIFYMSRVVDLLDTVFMVLKKNYNQISFLHIYHHSLMVIVSWYITSFTAGACVVVFGMMNSFVHTVMYCYYLLTAIRPEYKKSIWWKKHLTQLQLVQFVLIGLYYLFLVVNPNSKIPKVLFAPLLPQTVFIFVLFWDFYKKSYNRKKLQ